MVRKIFSIFLNILLKVFQIKPAFRFLRKYKILILLCSLVVLVGLVLWLRTFSLSDILDYKKQLFYYVQDEPLLTAILFFLMYILASTLSLPGTVILSVIGGFLFGFIQGLVFSVLAVSIGSCFAFLITRYFLRRLFIKKASSKIEKISNYLKQDEIYYLLAFRLFPFTPLFFTNMIMGLTSMRLDLFFIVSFIAFLPTLSVYVNMGSQLSRLEDWEGLSDPYLLLAFFLMGLFPLAVRYILKFLKRFKKSKEELSLDSDQVFLS